MTTVPVYDPDSMGIAAGQVEKLKDEFEKSKRKVTGVDEEKESPFGAMGGSGDVHSAVGTFKQGVHRVRRRREADGGHRFRPSQGRGADRGSRRGRQERCDPAPIQKPASVNRTIKGAEA
jgi:hypothetical protein